MKHFIIVLALILGTTSKSICQTVENSRKNLVFAEFGGAVTAGIGLGYERYFEITPKWNSTVRGGVGRVGHFTAWTSFAGGSLIWGRVSGLELGMNYLINYDASTFENADSEPTQFKNGFQALVGYRYRSANEGLIFRIFYVPPVGCCGNFLGIYGGASVGYAF